MRRDTAQPHGRGELDAEQLEITPFAPAGRNSHGSGRLPPAMSTDDDDADGRLRAGRGGGLRAAVRAPRGWRCTASCAGCWAAPTRRRSTRCSRTPGCASCRRARAGSRRARAFAPGCSRWRTTAPSTCCARADARSRSTPSRARTANPGNPTPPPGSIGPHRPPPRRRATSSRSGAAPASGCCGCLDELPLAQRSAFLLHHDDGLSLAEVAHALEVGFETAKTRLRYAMNKLRTCMGAYLAPESPR